MPINANGKLRVKGVGQIGPILTDFISVWDTNLGDGQPTIQLPLGGASSNYNFDVNWGDGTTDNIQGNGGLITGYYSHTYALGGVYTVTITGTIEGWSFAGVGECAKITSITNIGPLKLGNEGAYFYGCSNLTTIGGIFDLTGTTNFSSMFDSCTSLTSVNGINSWNTSAVTGMGDMFNNAANFNQNIGGWDVSSVTEMGGMFINATSFNQPLNSWNTSAVISMGDIFNNATSFNQDISGWDVSSVTGMNGMFADATAFNQPLNSWNTSAVTNMSYMFYNATTFNQPLNSWDVSSVTNMGGMFNDATVFNQSLNSWNTAAVTDMNEMFSGAIAFNQDISGWDVSNVTYMDSFMYGKSTADYDYYDNLLNSWSLLTLQNGVNWDMGSIEYTSAGAAARASIIGNYSWTINDGGLAV